MTVIRAMVSFIALFSAAFAALSDELIVVPIAELHPTQGAIGHLQIEYKLQRYRIEREKLFDDLCEAQGLQSVAAWDTDSNPHQLDSYECELTPEHRKYDDIKTAVRGPQGQLFLTDGHHTFSTFQEMPEGGPTLPVVVRVTHDQSHLSRNEFWSWMKAQQLTWLFDGEGQPIAASELPRQLGRANLQNSELRAAAYFLRGIAWEKPENALPFIEFRWARALLEHVPAVHHYELSRDQYWRWLHQVAGAFSAVTVDDDLQRLKRINVALDILLCEEASIGKLSTAYLRFEPSPRCAKEEIYIPEGHAKLNLDVLPIVNVLIEIPAGSHEKWEVNKVNWNRLEWDRQDGQVRYIEHLGYPLNYGAIPGTQSEESRGGDGDPLDVLVLGEPLVAGAHYQVRIVGVMRMQDNGEDDDKLIAVLMSDPVFGEIETLAQLQQEFPALLSAVGTWFESYKGANARISGITWEDQAHALEILLHNQVP